MPSPDTAHIISVRDLHKSFGSVRALQGVSFDIPRGTIVGLLGPNGAGKTTLIRILTTLLAPDSGNAVVAGLDITHDPAQVRSHIGLAGQYAAVDETLTGRENLILVGRLYHLTARVARERAGTLLGRFSLAEAGDRAVKTYSGGMRRRLDLAASMVGDPEILFLDEPTSGLDPRSRMELWEMIREFVRDGTTVLLTTQYLEEADYLANAIILIDRGAVIARGTSRELKAKIGGGVVEVHVENQDDVSRVMPLLANIGTRPPQVNDLSGHITIPAQEGAKTLRDAIRILDGACVPIADIELRKPTLDEVFLALTENKSDRI